jgi:hypothetical protein
MNSSSINLDEKSKINSLSYDSKRQKLIITDENNEISFLDPLSKKVETKVAMEDWSNIVSKAMDMEKEENELISFDSERENKFEIESQSPQCLRLMKPKKTKKIILSPSCN